MEHRGRTLGLVAVITAAAATAGVIGQEPGAVMQDNVVVLLDASGSMLERMRNGPRKMDVAKDALQQVLTEVGDTTNIGLLVFGGRNVPNRWVYPLGPIDRNELGLAIRRPTPHGGTPLGKYMKIAADRLLEQREEQYGYGTYRLLVVTDGEANDASLVDRYTPDILARGITVDVIGVDMSGDHTLATRVHSYRKADDPDSLVRAVAEVLGEIGVVGDDAATAEQFEILAAIPDDMAGSMLEALTRSGNTPIGTVKAMASSNRSASARRNNPNRRTTSSSSKRSSGVAPIAALVSCMGCGTILLVLLGLVVKMIGGSSR